MKTAFTVLMIFFAAASAVISAISWFSPKCRKNYLPSKMANSASFLLTAVCAAFSVGTDKPYPILIIVALFFGLVGDFFLEWKKSKYFYAGVLAFIINHFIYIYTFSTQFSTKLNPLFKNMIIGFIVTAVIGIIFMQIDKIKLKGIENVMLIYSVILIFSFVFGVTRGIVEIRNANVPLGLCIAAGAAGFILSDSFLATQLYGKSRFKHPEAFVIFFYFPAQTLFALSIHFYA